MIKLWRTVSKRMKVRVSEIADSAFPSRLSNHFRVDQGFKLLLERGARLLLIFGDERERFDVFNGHVAMNGGHLRRYPRFQLATLTGADHTFTRVHDRRLLYARLLDFLND